MKEKHIKEKGSKVETIKNEVELLGDPEYVGNKIGYANWDPSGRFMGIFTENDARVHIYNIFGIKGLTIDEDRTSQVSKYNIKFSLFGDQGRKLKSQKKNMMR